MRGGSLLFALQRKRGRTGGDEPAAKRQAVTVDSSDFGDESKVKKLTVPKLKDALTVRCGRAAWRRFLRLRRHMASLSIVR